MVEFSSHISNCKLSHSHCLPSLTFQNKHAALRKQVPVKDYSTILHRLLVQKVKIVLLVLEYYSYKRYLEDDVNYGTNTRSSSRRN